MNSSIKRSIHLCSDNHPVGALDVFRRGVCDYWRGGVARGVLAIRLWRGGVEPGRAIYRAENLVDDSIAAIEIAEPVITN